MVTVHLHMPSQVWCILDYKSNLQAEVFPVVIFNYKIYFLKYGLFVLLSSSQKQQLII